MCVMSCSIGPEISGTSDRLLVDLLRLTPGGLRFDSLRTRPVSRVDGERATLVGPQDAGRPSFGEFRFIAWISSVSALLGRAIDGGRAFGAVVGVSSESFEFALVGCRGPFGVDGRGPFGVGSTTLERFSPDLENFGAWLASTTTGSPPSGADRRPPCPMVALRAGELLDAARSPHSPVGAFLSRWGPVDRWLEPRLSPSLG